MLYKYYILEVTMKSVFKKRIQFLFVVCIALLPISACSKVESSQVSPGRLSYTSTPFPLMAYYTRNSVNTSDVTIRVKGKTAAMDIAHTFEAGYGTKFPIFGLYPDYENRIEITDGVQTIVENITTKALQPAVSDAIVYIDNLPKADAFNQDLYWIAGSHSREWSVIAYDRKGDIRGYYAFTDKIADQVIRVFEKYGEIRIETIMDILSLEGEVYTTASDFHRYHHDVIELSNGNYVRLSHSTWGREDKVVEQTSRGEVVRDLALGTLFRDIVTTDEDREILEHIIYDDQNPYIENGRRKRISWAHCNSLVYDEDTGVMYFSLRNQGVIAVNYSEWKLIWLMVDDTIRTLDEAAPNPNLNFTKIESLQPYRVGGDALRSGPKNQHALFLFENGNLGMFDNQSLFGRGANPSGSRYVEYKIDGGHGDWVATIEREYSDSDLYSRTRSDADITGEGHLLVGWSNVKRIEEIDLDTGEVLFDMETGDAFYRMDKMPIYPYQDPNKKYAMDYNEKEGK